MNSFRRRVLSMVASLAIAFPSGATENAAPLLLVKADLASLSLEELANLEVTSVSKTPEKYRAAPAAIFVITQKDLQRTGVTSLAEALRLAPGVDVARIGSSLWSVGVRGFSDRLSRSVLVLLDGRAVYAPLFAGTYWEVQDYPLEDIDRIEVIRGPGGTLWGANAFNGVINIITKNSWETQGGLVSAGGGTEERGFGTVRFGGKSGQDAAYRVYGKYFNRDSAYHADEANFDEWWMGQGGFRTDWNVNSEDSLTLQGDLYQGRTGARFPVATYPSPFLRILQEDGKLFGANFLGRWKRAITSTSGTTFQWYYDRTDRNDLQFHEFRDTLDLDFQNHFASIARQEWTWGLGYRMTSARIGAVPTIIFDPEDRTDHLASVFVQDQVALIENVLRLTFGTKVEHNDYSGWEFQPSGRLAWTPTESQMVWTSVSRAVRTPSQVEQDLVATQPVTLGSPGFARQIANPDFKSETLTAYEWGYRVQPAPSLFMDLAAFYNRYDNLLTGEFQSPLIFLEATPVPAHLVLPVVLGNNMEGETHGLEWTGTWNPLSWWRMRATYSLLLMHLRVKPHSTASGAAAVTEGNSPRHQAFLHSSVDLPHHVEVDPIARFTDVLSSQGVPAYWSMDLRVAWRPVHRLELALIGQNLLQSHHVETIPDSPLSAPPPPLELQRGFYGKVTWTW